ncbi:hypothetical protein DXC89_09050 [Prevotella disiens]|uniref:Uncharacterized protein n=1 Tax=Prevotella disiens TaxID=28130 RepID=A0A3E4QIR4_9BACT|nr:hypothetical protein DXC89_09050 [Prevotella disiens]
MGELVKVTKIRILFLSFPYFTAIVVSRGVIYHVPNNQSNFVGALIYHVPNNQSNFVGARFISFLMTKVTS